MTSNWADLVLRGLADGEEVQDFHVVTLKSFYNSLVTDTVMNTTYSSNVDFDKWAEKKTKYVMDSGKIAVRQFVAHDEETDSVTVCLDVEKITNEIVNDALEKLAEIGFENGSMTFFGDSVTYTHDEYIKQMPDKTFGGIITQSFT